ncbi:hypothetical protein TNCV_71051 [Trichonephila clavipes]|nr:hypothetical protein TNCV_71051 [Trichonephila clavipes]
MEMSVWEYRGDGTGKPEVNRSPVHVEVEWAGKPGTGQQKGALTLRGTRALRVAFWIRKRSRKVPPGLDVGQKILPPKGVRNKIPTRPLFASSHSSSSTRCHRQGCWTTRIFEICFLYMFLSPGAEFSTIVRLSHSDFSTQMMRVLNRPNWMYCFR